MQWFLLLLFCCQALSHPASTELTRLPRELIECCPCNGEDSLARSSQVAASRVDDCPCRARSADSEGSSSVFFPSAVRPDGTHIRSNNPKEEQKNLLEPEVGLATSMLETLREATEEEYQNALARDAARSAADARSDESKNLLIVVQPSSADDAIPQASHGQESRWVHPLGSSLNRMRTVPTESKLLPDTLKLPKLRRPSVPYRNLFDMDADVGASNLKEIVTEDKAKDSLTKTPLLRSNILKVKSPDNLNDDTDFASSKVLGRSKVKNLLEGLKLPVIPKLNDLGLRNTGDISSAPSSNLEILDDQEIKPSLPRFAKPPALLKNLLKLKDVELIPKTHNLLKKPLFALPKMPAQKLRSTGDEENSNDNETDRSTAINIPETKQLNLEPKSKIEPLKTVRESGNELDVVDGSNRLINQAQDTISSPSDIRTATLENPGNDSGALGSEDQDDNNNQRINDSDFDRTQLQEQPKLKEDHIAIDCVDDKMKSANDFVADSSKVEGTASREILSEDEDAFTDSSNVNNVITEPFSTIKSPVSDELTPEENISSFIDPSQFSTNSEIVPQNVEGDNQNNNNNNKNEAINPVPSLSDTLSAIRNNIKKLDKFIKTTRNPAMSGGEENSKPNTNLKNFADSGLGSNEDDTIIIFDNDGNPEVIESKNAKEPESVTLDDLQKLSDNLLDSSNQDEKFVARPELQNQQSEIKSDINNLKDNTITADNNPIGSSQIVKEERSEDSLIENACPNRLNDDKVIEKSSKSVSHESDSLPRDMTVDASEPIMSVLPKVLDPLNLSEKVKSPIFENPIVQSNLNLDPLNLLNNRIVQPSLPENPLNLLNNPLDDLINLNPTLPPLPSLDDIRDQISNVFNTNARSNDDAVENCDYDEKEIEKMATEASATDRQTKLPTIKSLDNLNVDLFQLGPMKSPKPDPLGSNRNLNLNSFRTKVPIPKNFELKPVKLESSIRNMDGLQRASAKLSSKSPISKTKLPSKVNLLGSPGVNFPSLDEIRQSLQRNPTTLLGNPIQHDLSLFKTSPIEGLNRNAEKTLKGIQKRLRTTLKSPKMAEPALVNPQEFLEDVGDKLKAIHYDLNDRLASAHDNLLESTKLALPNHFLGTNDKKNNKNIIPSFRTRNGKPMRLQTSASTSPQNVYIPTEKSGRKTSLRTPQTKIASNKMPSKLSTQDFAASDSVPIKVQPNLQGRTPMLDTKQFPVQRSGERSSLFKTTPSLQKSIFTKPNFKESKVRISFDPTTTKPILKSDNSLSKNRIPSITRVDNGSNLKTTELSRNTKPNANVDRISSSAEVNPWFVPLEPLKTPKRLQTEKQIDTFKPRNSWNVLNPNTRISSNDKNKQKLLGTENEFLSKVKDAVKHRLSNFDSLKKDNVIKVGHKPSLKVNDDKIRVTPTDMLRSASENVNAVVPQESLKENIPYKCKLVCTKE